MYVLKFRGAGQGTRALIAELVSGEIARAIGLPVPEMVFAELDRDLSRTEPDPEIHQLIYDSAGLNLALDYLPGSVSFDPAVHTLDAAFASRVVWFDAFVSNVDRSPRNTNMLMWHRKPWLIDHGATLYFHHTPGWERDAGRAKAAFPLIKDHVLLPRASALEAADAEIAALLTADIIEGILGMVPEEWYAGDSDAATLRAAYARYLAARLEAPRTFVREALHAR